jgi:hypothetical protein
MREDTQRLEEEKATLDGMVESRDELVMEIAREIGLDRMGEDEDEEEEEEGANKGGDATAPPATALPPPAPAHEEIDEEGSVEAIPELEVPMPHEVVLADAEPEVPQLRLYHILMRDYEENPLRLEDDFDDVYNDPNEGRSDVDEWFPEDGTNDRD